MNSWASRHRLSKLQGDHGRIFLLALDHGISLGSLPGIEDIGHWGEFILESCIRGLVVNRGALSHLPPLGSRAVIVQLMGLPDFTGAARPKAIISTVRDAIRNGADAVAIQTTFEHLQDPQTFEMLARLIRDADAYSMPTLCMLNGKSNTIVPSTFVGAVRAMSEVGAATIKAPLPNLVTDADRELVRSALNGCCPVILSGGVASEQFEHELTTALSVGFAGTCVGRNIFQSHDPTSLVASIERILTNSPKVSQ